jgi:hypothetical protein
MGYRGTALDTKVLVVPYFSVRLPDNGGSDGPQIAEDIFPQLQMHEKKCAENSNVGMALVHCLKTRTCAILVERTSCSSATLRHFEQTCPTRYKDIGSRRMNIPRRTSRGSVL